MELLAAAPSTIPVSGRALELSNASMLHKVLLPGSPCQISCEIRGLVESYADPLPLTPNDVTGDVRAVRLKDKVETLGDVVGVSNIERRPRNGNVAD